MIVGVRRLWLAHTWLSWTCTGVSGHANRTHKMIVLDRDEHDEPHVVPMQCRLCGTAAAFVDSVFIGSP